MLSNLATKPSALAGPGAPLAPMAAPSDSKAAPLATCDRPAFVPAVYVTGATPAAGAMLAAGATRGRFQAGMALSNHNIKVWPLGPQDGSTG